MRVAPLLLVVALAAGCSEPLLKNAPRPPTSAVAGVAAAAATAAVLADPAGAGRAGEQAKKDGTPPGRTTPTRTSIPADVLDRLDRTAPPTAP